MKIFRFALATLLLVGLVAIAAPALANTYYVRTDGGLATKCDGTANAPASAAPHCAWSSPMEALPPTMSNYPHPAKIKGGDTLIIEPGQYRIGWTSGVYDRQHMQDPCDGAYAAGCTLQPVPSGTASAPTRILGAGWDSGCKAPPTLYGAQAINQVLDLDGANNVVIGCLDLTDHSNCTYNYVPNKAYSCDHSWVAYGQPANYGDWADKAIHAQDSSNVTLQDLNIHGFAERGVQAGRISNWSVTRVKVVGNGIAGWDGDLGGNNEQSTNSGTLTFTDLTIAWNGCAENYPNIGTYINCFGQNESGYGDGFAEAWTGGNFVFIRPSFHHNTQDGLDLLYANGTGSIKVDQGYFGLNAGNDIKTKGTTTITNSVFVAYCTVFKSLGMPAAADSCRAGGGELSDVTGPNQTVTFAYNTVVGEAGCLFGGDPDNANSTDVYQISNNIFIGQKSALQSHDGQYSCLGWFGDGTPPAKINYTNNIIWHVQDNDCPAGSICKDPLLKNETLAAFDPTLLSGSPAIHAAKGGMAVAVDYADNARANPTSIGALE